MNGPLNGIRLLDLSGELGGYGTRLIGELGADVAVVVCLTAFGLDGPLRDLRATHLTSYAMGGLMRRMGPPDGPPLAPPYQQMYDQLATHAAVCVLAGLRERPRVGGQFVELSLHELIGAQDDQVDRYAATAAATGRRQAPQAPPTGVWDCADGRVELLVHNPSHWRGFVRLVGSPSQLRDPALEQRHHRLDRRSVLVPAIAAALSALPVDEVVSRAERLGVPAEVENPPARFMVEEQPARSVPTSG